MKKYFTIILVLLSFSISGRVKQNTFNEQCKKSTEIYTGRVIQVTIDSQSKSSFGTFRTFKIVFVSDKIWKGLVNDTMTCLASEGICGSNIFEVDKKYLVYSENGKIDLTYGRSGDVEFFYIKPDMRKLYVRYLFRRPKNLSLNKNIEVFNYFNSKIIYTASQSKMWTSIIRTT